MSEQSKVSEQITPVKLVQITRFVARTGKNTRQAIPALTGAGYVYFPSELTPDLLSERDDPPAEGQTKSPFIGVDKAHPFGIVMWDMVFGPGADEKSKKFFVKLIRENEQTIYSIAMSVYRLGQRDPIEVVQDEEGYRLVDGFVRLVSCTIRDILAELSKNKPHGTIRAQVVEETKQDVLEDISLQKNMMRAELKKSDLARRFYEMSLVGREDEAGGGDDEADNGEEGETPKKKKRTKKAISDQQIADRCGLPKEGGRQKVFQFRTVYEWCINQGAKGQTYLDKWDANKLTLKELLEKAQGKSGGGTSGEEPRERKTTRPRCLSYPAAYKLYKNDVGLSKVVEGMFPEVPVNVKLALVRYGLSVAMQQADKAEPEAPATDTPPAKGGTEGGSTKGGSSKGEGGGSDAA